MAAESRVWWRIVVADAKTKLSHGGQEAETEKLGRTGTQIINSSVRTVLQKAHFQ